MRARVPAAFLLSVCLATVHGQSPAGQMKDPPKDKEPSKGASRNPGPKWPTVIGGKDVRGWLKDVDNPDPAIREAALKALPNFGPDARPICSKKLVERMGKERDPGVRITVFNAASVLGLEDSEVRPAVLILARIVDEGASGGLSRLHAVQTLGFIGPKAEGAINALTGVACNDSAYTTRQAIANALSTVGYDEVTGPNHKALNRLATTFVRDESAAVRMEALQSLVLLGPPWEGPVRKGVAPVIDYASKTAFTVSESMRTRLGMTKSKGAIEPDKQLEIWCRVVLMRFDHKELDNPVHMNAIGALIASEELGPKLQALQALAIFGERSAVKLDEVMRALRVDDESVKTTDDFEPLVLTTALAAIAAMGEKASGAVSRLEAIEKKLAKMREERIKGDDFKKLTVDAKPEQIKALASQLQEEYLRATVANTIDYVKKSKPGLPGGGPAAAAPGPGDKK